MDAAAHWQRVYTVRVDDELSWHQPEPQPSLDLIIEACEGRGRVIDVGGGSSPLVDRLLDAGFEKVAVLDIASAALDRARSRLGARAAQAEWIVADVSRADNLGQFDVWHDRAVFHFLTNPLDRAKYVRLARQTVKVEGHLILGTFASDGPLKCSGLDVRRYDAASMTAELGNGFEMLRQIRKTHLTPKGHPQPFQYCVFRRVA